jgi:integrase
MGNRVPPPVSPLPAVANGSLSVVDTMIEAGNPLFYRLRHFAGTMTARVGGTVATTMRRLGHSTVSASMAYQAAVGQRDHDIAAALSKLANGDQKDR